MTPLGEALRKKFKTPQEALAALGLDEGLLKTRPRTTGDQKLKGQPMKLQTKALPSRKALLLQGAISAALVGKLAADASIDLTPVLDGVTRTTLKAKAPAIKAGLSKALKGKLAQDEDLGEVVETVAELIDNLKDVQSGEAEEDDLTGLDENDPEKEPEGKKAEDEDPAKILEDLKGKVSEETYAKVAAELAGKNAEDADPEKKPDEEKVSKEAMDAAIKQAREEGSREAVRRVNAIAEAKRQVRPLVGDLDGDFDTAEAVHKFALDAAIEQGLDIDLAGVPATAYGALVKTAIQLTEAQAKRPVTTTHDSKGATKAAELFPGLARIRVS